MAQVATVRADHVTAGIATMVATAAAMSLGDALVKVMSADLGLWQFFVLRSAVALPLLVLLLRTRGTVWPSSRHVLRWCAVRSLLLIGMWVSFYAALTLVDLATVATAYYTGPLFITLLSALVARERVGWRRWLAVSAGFAGVVLMLRPDQGAIAWPVLFAVLSGLFYALAAVVTRVRLADESPLVLSGALNIAFLVAGALGTGLLLAAALEPATVARQPFVLGPWQPMTLQAWTVVAGLGVLIVAISTGVARAYQLAPSSIIATFDYAYLPFAALWGFAFFAAVPDATTLAGMALIAAAGLSLLRLSRG